MNNHLPSRRGMIGKTLAALGGLGLPAGTPAHAAPVRASAAPPRGRGRAKNIIYLHMEGAPSQLDLFDWKPRLQQMSGKPCPASFLEGKRFAFIRGVPTMMGSPFAFARHGQSGAPVSALLPRFSKLVDQVSFIRTMRTDEFNHAPAQLFAHTGKAQFGGAALGSWVTQGRGSRNPDLPGFVVLLSGGKTPSAGKSLWGSGFLPSARQGVEIRNDADRVLFLGDPAGLDRAGRRATLDTLGVLNSAQAAVVGDPEIIARTAQYELAYRMQAVVPQVMDIAREPKHILDLYGARPGHRSASETAEDPRTLYKGDDPTFANNCLLARRLVESGVRFVQLFDWGWDHHGISAGESIDQTLPIKAQQIDRAVAGLITDLKQRGLFDDTLIVWGGEFGRTPMQQNPDTQRYVGRDHHPFAFTMWLAGGGVKAGHSIGETDELGYYPVKDPVHMRDLQATILHLAGLDPFGFSYPYQGLDQRLIGPDDQARIVTDLLV